MRFLMLAKYRREVLVKRPCRRLYQNAKMQIDFPSKDRIGQLKKAVDAAELQLRGGGTISDYGAAVEGTKKVAESGGKLWETGTTIAKSGNAMVEVMDEWKKKHYF